MGSSSEARDFAEALQLNLKGDARVIPWTRVNFELSSFEAIGVKSLPWPLMRPVHGLALQSRDGASRKTLTQVVKLAMADWKQMVRGHV